ncbi:ArsR family transcriptional regulator [Tamaricihabitans halophyticus]|uniref:ArsR family transcriptional regulator n=1 Tax=Tamaricihabitans halophyticus TaxID=1262583 RepID=A0A4R2R101_9PSEU|nr:metalloregulator ArsR/SmtB family transcription factor [Tamaricihabitans halophyticus]TCP56342.1 ArsR family transcriptional regulator [Tamaricihabitans halophyticus]
MDDVFRALADPHRRRLLDSLNARGGQRLYELCANLDMARQSVSKHLAVLEAANLVTTIRRGREKLHYLNAAPIQALSDRWMRQYDRRRAEALADLTRALEEPPMAEQAFVYTTFIKTTPEKLWQALTDPAFTSQYWGVTFETDWQPGSPMVWNENGSRIVDPGQTVLTAEPYRKLAYTWHVPTEEWGVAVGIDESLRSKLATERRSKVTFTLEPFGETVKLTVVHDDFPPESTMREMVSGGWPHLLSDLKTLLETGETLPPVPAEAWQN